MWITMIRRTAKYVVILFSVYIYKYVVKLFVDELKEKMYPCI